MGLENCRKFLKSPEWLKKGESVTPSSFDSFMIFFRDGEFMLQPSDIIEIETLEENENVVSFTYVNEGNRIDCLHMAILFIILNETEKTRESFLSFQFIFNEFFELYDKLGFTVSDITEEKDEYSKYKVEVPSADQFNTITFTLDSIVKATVLMLTIFYKGKQDETT